MVLGMLPKWNSRAKHFSMKGAKTAHYTYMSKIKIKLDPYFTISTEINS